MSYLPWAKLMALFGSIAVCKNMLLVLHTDKHKNLSNFTEDQRTPMSRIHIHQHPPRWNSQPVTLHAI